MSSTGKVAHAPLVKETQRTVQRVPGHLYETELVNNESRGVLSGNSNDVNPPRLFADFVSREAVKSSIFFADTKCSEAV